MKFVPVVGTRVLFSIWDTRVNDFETFVNDTGYDATEGVFSLGKDGWKQTWCDMEKPEAWQRLWELVRSWPSRRRGAVSSEDSENRRDACVVEAAELHSYAKSVTQLQTEAINEVTDSQVLNLLTLMKALRFHAKRDLRVDDIAAPKQCGPNQVIVKTSWCGICGTDLHEFMAGPIFIPKDSKGQILGHEFGGELVEVGSGIKDYRVGDRVSIQPLITPKEGYYESRGLNQLSDHLTLVGLSWPWGGMGEYALVNESNIAKIPESVTDEQAAAVEPAAVTINALDKSGLRAGDTALVTGGGPIGALAVLSANAAGASKIFVSEPNSVRRKLMEELESCTAAYDPVSQDVAALIREQTEGKAGADVAMECSGNDKGLLTCLQSVRRQGTIVQVGLPTAVGTLDMHLLVTKDIHLLGSWCYPVTSWPRVIGLIAAGRLPVEKVVTSKITLEEAVPKGFEVLTSKENRDLKVLIRLGAGS